MYGVGQNRGKVCMGWDRIGGRVCMGWDRLGGRYAWAGIE